MPHATFALACRDGKIVDAPPIARWAIGRDERDVARYYRSKGAEFADLPEVVSGLTDDSLSAGSRARPETANPSARKAIPA